MGTRTRLAKILSYVRARFAEGASAVDRETVARVRAQYATRTTAWTPAELGLPVPKGNVPPRPVAPE